MNNTNAFNKTRRGAAALILALGAGAGTIATATAATPDADVPSVVVRYADLNLSTEQGVKTLYKRISTAAAAVCPDAATYDVERLQLERACKRQAIERAVQAVHNDRLAAVYATDVRHG